jgi:WD40 repeat protein
MIYFHLALLLHSLIISSLCNAMNESDHYLSSDHHLPLVRSFSTEKNILGIEFPTDNTVLTIHDHGWSTFCLKTEEQKIYIENEQYISDFDLSKDGKIAITDPWKLTVYNIETGKIIYKKYMLDTKRIAFCSNNGTLGIYYPFRNVITIHTIEKEEEREEEYNTPPDVGQGLFAGNPTNKEFIIGNRIVKCVTGDKDTITTYLPGDVTNMLSSSYNPDGTVIAIKRKDGYLFHKRENGQDFVINNNKNSYKYAPYYSVAFHPKKRFAALLTEDNRIEFWDYTKETEKTLAIIELPSKDNRPFSKLTSFAPNGKILAVIIAGGNTFYTVTTPETAYYDDATKAQCVAFIWSIKNPDLPFIPQDIVKLIMHKLSRIPDFQLPQQITQ